MSRGWLLWLFAILPEIELTCLLKFGVPFFAKSANERLFEELIEPDAMLPAEDFGGFAYFPAVEIHGSELSELLQAQGIKVARDWFVEVDASLSVSSLNGALAHTILGIACENAVFAVDDLRHEVAFFIYVSHAICFNHFLSLRHKVVPYFGENFL